MANDAVAMLKSSQVEESQGKRVVAMRGAKEKKTRQEGFAGRHETGGSFCGFCLACEAVVHKRQARKVCSAGGCGREKKTGRTLQVRRARRQDRPGG